MIFDPAFQSKAQGRRGKRVKALSPAGRFLVLASTLATAICLPSIAQADVLDIGDDGGTTLLRGPSLVRSTDLQSAVPLDRPSRVVLYPARSGYLPAPAIQARPAVLAAISQAASRVGLPSQLIEAVAWQESRMRQETVSPKGAVGVMQLMPGTARQLGVDASDVASNVHGGALYLRMMVDRYDGDLNKALAAYNAGPKAVDRYGGIPPYQETRIYVSEIIGRLRRKNFFSETTK